MAFPPYRLLFRHFAGSNRAVLLGAKASWSNWSFLRTSCAQLSAVAPQPLVLKATEFQHLFEEGPTEAIYNDTPVRSWSQSQQGEVLQEWAKRVLEEKNPEFVFSDPEPGICHNGRRRALHHAPYDFLMEGRRVEVKSGRLSWDSAHRYWYTRFSNVKFSYGERTEAAFDDLYLVTVSPKGLYLLKHDLETGISANGKVTEVYGHKIRVCGSRGSRCWQDALSEILHKLLDQGDCSLVAEESFDLLSFQTGPLSKLPKSLPPKLRGIPTQGMSSPKRGKQIQAIGFAIDQRLNPQEDFSLIGQGVDACGQTRSTSNALVDWVRGATRVELKSCGLRWERANYRWECSFQGVKPDHFDELWLAIRNPIGIHFYRSECPKSLGFSRAGAATEHIGSKKVVGGRCHQDNPLEALVTIGAKLISKGFELVAFLKWDGGASVPSWRRKSMRLAAFRSVGTGPRRGFRDCSWYLGQAARSTH